MPPPKQVSNMEIQCNQRFLFHPVQELNLLNMVVVEFLPLSFPFFPPTINISKKPLIVKLIFKFIKISLGKKKGPFQVPKLFYAPLRSQM